MKKSIISIFVCVLVFCLSGCQTKLQSTINKLETGMTKEAAWEILKQYGQPNEALSGVPVMVDKNDKVLTFLKKDSMYINVEKTKENFTRLYNGYKKSGNFEKEENCRLVLEALEEFKNSGNKINYVELWIYEGKKSTNYQNIYVIFKNNKYAFHLAFGFNEVQAEIDQIKAQQQMMAGAMLMQQGNAYNYQLQQQRYYNQQNNNLRNINNSLQDINATLRGL